MMCDRQKGGCCKSSIFLPVAYVYLYKKLLSDVFRNVLLFRVSVWIHLLKTVCHATKVGRKITMT